MYIHSYINIGGCIYEPVSVYTSIYLRVHIYIYVCVCVCVCVCCNIISEWYCGTNT